MTGAAPPRLFLNGRITHGVRFGPELLAGAAPGMSRSAFAALDRMEQQLSQSTTSSPASAAVGRPAGASSAWHWLALPLVLVGMFMTILDFSIVNVAIPSIQSDLGASSAHIQLVVAGYSLTYGAGLITGGRLGDRFGRRRVYLIGLTLFTLASVACGLAPSPLALVIGRMVQGAAAAVLFPQVLSILNVTYTGAERARAYTWYGLVLGTAWVGGQVLGGVLIRADVFDLSWRMCFLINIPVGIATLLLFPLVVGESRSAAVRRLDLVGVVIVTVGLLMLVLPLVEGRQAGWPLWSVLSLVGSFPVLAGFLAYQRRRAAAGGSPLVEPSLLRSRPFLTGIGTVFATYASMASFFLIFAVYLQEGQGYDALGSGIAFLPLGLGFFATSVLGARITRLIGPSSISAGAVLLAASEVWLGLVARSGGAHVGAWSLAPGLALTGIGMGMVLAPLISRALAGVDPDHAGSASGLLSTMQQVGNSVGVALIGLIFYGILGPHPRPGAAYSHAFAGSMIYAVALAVIVAVLALALPRPAAAR
jgi:EmrB/QacA subfamily drug resistance transporter